MLTFRMLALHVTVFVLLCSGVVVRGWWFTDECNNMITLEGRMLMAVMDNDVDDDGDMDAIDFAQESIRYQSDDNLCDTERAELRKRWTCRYGWSTNYADFMFNRSDANNDGRLTSLDQSGSAPYFTKKAFTQLQYKRFKFYCKDPANRAVDRDCVRLDAMPVPSYID